MKSYILKAYENINNKYLKYKEEKALKDKTNEANNVETLEIIENVDNFEEREIVVSNHNDSVSNKNDIEIVEMEKEHLFV